MKMNKFWNKTDDKTVAINYCKKCGCELISTNKNKLCDNCQRKKVSKIKNGAGITLSVLGMTVLAVLGKGKYKK